MEQSSRSTSIFVAGEATLAVVALLIAHWTEIPLGSQLVFSAEVVWRGVFIGITMIAVGFGLLQLLPWAPIVQLRRQVEAIVLEIFGETSWPELALISLAAGIGEELLFRGALQSWIGSHTGPLVAVIVVSALFGAAHALSNAYFVAATLIGLLFGWMTEYYGDLLAPIIAHSIYDFVALLLIRRNAKRAMAT